METIKIARYASPAGELTIGGYRGKICICDWSERRHPEDTERQIKRYIGAGYEIGTSAVIEQAITQLDEYFSGRRTDFKLPLEIIGTDFQRAVRNELLNIPYGTTISYAELARRTGNPKAVRAVAAANASNPLSIFVPCHRVIGSDRQLTGYGGGLHVKKFLLELEAAHTGAND